MKTHAELPRAARCGLSLTLGLLALTLTACSTTHKLTFQPPPAPGPKHPLKVGLVLDNSFCTFQHKRDPEGYVYPIGDYVCQCCPAVAQGSFQEVRTFDSLEAAVQSPDVDAVLVPKVVKVEIRARGVAWEKRRVLVVMEWTLKQKQQTVWLATVEGRAENNVGTMFSMDGNDREAFQMAMDDLCRKSLQSFQDAQEIRALGNKAGGQ